MILPEVLVVPLTSELQVPDTLVGVFASLIAVGAIVGMVLAPRDGDHVALLRSAAIRAAVLAALTGALFALDVGPAVIGLAFVISGTVDAIAVPTNQVVGERLPIEGRSAAMAVAGGVQNGAQVITVSAAGAIATLSFPRVPLTIGMFCAAAICVWAVVRPADRHVTDSAPDAAQPA
jgi:MFS family permease